MVVPVPVIYADSFTVYANGTVYFDLTNTVQSEPAGKLSLTVTGYGNGTLQLRFKGEQPIQIIAMPASQSYTQGYQQFQYTANTVTSLQLIWITGLATGGAIRNGAFYLALFISALFPAKFILEYTVAEPEERVEVTNKWRGRFLVIGTVVVLLFIIAGLFG